MVPLRLRSSFFTVGMAAGRQAWPAISYRTLRPYLGHTGQRQQQEISTLAGVCLRVCLSLSPNTYARMPRPQKKRQLLEATTKGKYFGSPASAALRMTCRGTWSMLMRRTTVNTSMTRLTRAKMACVMNPLRWRDLFSCASLLLRLSEKTRAHMRITMVRPTMWSQMLSSCSAAGDCQANTRRHHCCCYFCCKSHLTK